MQLWSRFQGISVPDLLYPLSNFCKHDEPSFSSIIKERILLHSVLKHIISRAAPTSEKVISPGTSQNGIAILCRFGTAIPPSHLPKNRVDAPSRSAWHMQKLFNCRD